MIATDYRRKKRLPQQPTYIMLDFACYLFDLAIHIAQTAFRPTSTNARTNAPTTQTSALKL